MSRFGKGPLSRRSMLKGMGLGAVGAGLSFAPAAFAQDGTGDMSSLPLAVDRLAVGDIEIVTFKEAELQLQPSMFGGGAPEGAVTELLEQYNLPTEVANASANVMLLDNNGQITLIDTGTGSNVAGSLEALGVPPTGIGSVVLTHWHGDHVGGVAVDGALTFPNALHYFPQADWDFLQSAAGNNESAQGSLAKLQVAEAAGLLELYSDAQQLVPGVTSIAAPGHTPGHHVLSVASGNEEMMVMADTAAHFLVSLTHPEWAFSFDADPEQATETRHQLYGRAADEGIKVSAYHFPFPGAGYIAREGNGYRFLPYH